MAFLGRWKPEVVVVPPGTIAWEKDSKKSKRRMGGFPWERTLRTGVFHKKFFLRMVYVPGSINSHYFHMIGDKLINPIVGVYISIIRISY